MDVGPDNTSADVYAGGDVRPSSELDQRANPCIRTNFNAGPDPHGALYVCGWMDLGRWIDAGEGARTVNQRSPARQHMKYASEVALDRRVFPPVGPRNMSKESPSSFKQLATGRADDACGTGLRHEVEDTRLQQHHPGIHLRLKLFGARLTDAEKFADESVMVTTQATERFAGREMTQHERRRCLATSVLCECSW